PFHYLGAVLEDWQPGLSRRDQHDPNGLPDEERRLRLAPQELPFDGHDVRLVQCDERQQFAPQGEKALALLLPTARRDQPAAEEARISAHLLDGSEAKVG